MLMNSLRRAAAAAAALALALAPASAQTVTTLPGATPTVSGGAISGYNAANYNWLQLGTSGNYTYSPLLAIWDGANRASVNAGDGGLTVHVGNSVTVSGLGSPFQAGGSIGNTAFGISGTLPAFATPPNVIPQVGGSAVSSGNPLPITGAVTAAFGGYTPSSYLSTITTTGSSARTALAGAVSTSTVVVYNTGSNLAYASIGKSSVTATAASDVIFPNCWAAYTAGQSSPYIAVLQGGGGSTTLNVSIGTGAAAGGCAATLTGASTVTANQGTPGGSAWPVSMSSLPGFASTPTVNFGTLNGAATAANQAAINGDGGSQVHVQNFPSTQAVSGSVTANAGSGTFAVSAASLPLPSGAATSANQVPAAFTAANAATPISVGTTNTTSGTPHRRGRGRDQCRDDERRLLRAGIHGDDEFAIYRPERRLVRVQHGRQFDGVLHHVGLFDHGQPDRRRGPAGRHRRRGRRIGRRRRRDHRSLGRLRGGRAFRRRGRRRLGSDARNQSGFGLFRLRLGIRRRDPERRRRADARGQHQH